MQRLKARNITLVLDEKAKDLLVNKGYDPAYGARPMRRAVERALEDPLAEDILKGTFHEGEPINVTAEIGGASFSDSNPASFYRAMGGGTANGQTSPFSDVFTIP